jgi:hypothetical protein
MLFSFDEGSDLFASRSTTFEISVQLPTTAIHRHTVFLLTSKARINLLLVIILTIDASIGSAILSGDK